MEMKAKEVVAQLAASREYQDFALAAVEAIEAGSYSPKLVERVTALYNVLNRKVRRAGVDFLRQVTRSCRPKGASLNRIRYSAAPHAVEASRAFWRQVQEQLPVYDAMMCAARDLCSDRAAGNLQEVSKEAEPQLA